ncbi:MAG: ABC transporter permease [Acidobacteriaceae bacterium]|nr:ABC transporter permease [Acidobacteriaceae bacterium]
MMETLWQDIRYAVRMLIKNWAFSAVAVLSLALGIGANTTIFTVVNAILLNPLPVRDISRVVQVDTVDARTIITQANATKQGMSYQNFQDYAKHNQVFTDLACIAAPPLTWSNGATPTQLQGELVSANYFELLGLHPAAGRFFTRDEDRKPDGNNVAVVSYSFWANRFGADPNLVGKTLILNAVPYTVVGIAPRGFKGTFTFASAEQIWIPVSMYREALSGFFKDAFNERRFLATTVIGRLKDGIPIAQAEAALKIMALHLEREYPKDNAGRSVALTPLADAAVGANNHSQITRAGGLMMGVVGLVLLIACANLVNLLLAQASRREKEIALRAALGANRGRVLRQLLTESVVLALSGGIVGLFIAYAGRTALWSLRPPFLENGDIDLALDSHVLLFTLTLALVTALLIGLVPALKATKPDLAEILKVGGRTGTADWTRSALRNLLVISEVALALIALVCAGLFIRSMQNAQRIQPGFESKSLFVMAFDLGALHYSEGRAQQFFRAAIERAQASPGVKSVAIASNLPLNGTFARTIFPEWQNEASGYRGTLTQLDDITPTFFETLRIPLIRGRVFTEADRQNTKLVAIASEAMAKHFWPNQDAVGKRFHFFGDPTLREIVGVVGNTVINRVGEEPQPLVYLPITQDFAPVATLQVRTIGRPQAVMGTVRKQIQSIDPNLALTNVQTIEELMAQALWASRMGAGMLTIFGLLALVLALVGVYGVLSYSVNQQTREIGIRVALGAQSAQVRWSVIANGLKLAGMGLLLGGITALILTNALSSLLFGVSSHDLVTFCAASLGLTVAAMLACYIPARRATKVDPIIALRYE